MPTVRLYPTYAGGTTLSKNPVSSTPLQILSASSVSSYLYIGNGYSDDRAQGQIVVNFGANNVLQAIGANSVINSCSVRAEGKSNGEFGYSDPTIRVSMGAYSMLISTPSKQWMASAKIWTTNPITKTLWTPASFDEDFLVTVSTDVLEDVMLSSVFIEIDYAVHEVFNTPLGHIKMQSGSSMLSIPFFTPSLISYPALRIGTSKGVGAFSLVETTDAYASPIRINTSKGIRAIAYKK